MNKQEALKKIEKLDGLTIKDKDFNFAIEMIPKGEALEIVNQLDEPEKPVVPKFVADWLEVCKDNLALSLANSMNNVVMRANNQPDKTIHWIAKNSETFSKAWIYGYEVEKEKLYTVELPSPNCQIDDHYILSRLKNGKIIINRYCIEQWERFGDCQLTEAEIKKDFEWAWQFAKEVEE